MNIEKEVSKPIFKATLLAISLFIMMPSVISPALPLMEKAFPNIPRVTVELPKISGLIETRASFNKSFSS